MTGIWNFIFERARPFSFCKGHFYWKVLKSMGNFWRGTKAKTRGNGGRAPRCLREIPSLVFISLKIRFCWLTWRLYSWGIVGYPFWGVYFLFSLKREHYCQLKFFWITRLEAFLFFVSLLKTHSCFLKLLIDFWQILFSIDSVTCPAFKFEVPVPGIQTAETIDLQNKMIHASVQNVKRQLCVECRLHLKVLDEAQMGIGQSVQ